VDATCQCIEVENPRTSEGHNFRSKAHFLAKLPSLESSQRVEDDGDVKEMIRDS
jgi:hypothetical protein